MARVNHSIWWDDFKNEKHLLHIPNADHPLNFIPPSAAKGVQVFGTALLPFYSAVVHDVPRPTFTWDIAADGHSITVGNFSSAAMPEKVSVWAATFVCTTVAAGCRVTTALMASLPHTL